MVTDPALAKALEARAVQVGRDHEVGSFTAGWHAFARSLGAATPEAQAALRELAQAAIELDAAQRAEPEESDVDWARWVARIVKAQKARNIAIAAFAALATPTEEGQG